MAETPMRKSHVRRVTRKVVRVHRKDGTSYTYVRKSSTTKVRPSYAYDVGTIGQSKSRIGPLKHGMLTRFGYHPVEAKTNRRKALSKGVSKGEEPLAVMRRLIAISTLTKRTAPRASRIYKQDAMWVRSKYAKSFKTRL